MALNLPPEISRSPMPPKAPKVAAWFKKHPRYHLHFTPTSGSWLNQVERWFAKITEQRIRRGVFKNVDALITASMSTSRPTTARPNLSSAPPRLT